MVELEVPEDADSSYVLELLGKKAGLSEEALENIMLIAKDGDSEWVLDVDHAPGQLQRAWAEKGYSADDAHFVVKSRRAMPGASAAGAGSGNLEPPTPMPENQDLVTLSNLNENMLLENLDKRFAGGNIYTYVGPILIALNPFRYVHFAVNVPD